MPGTEQHGQVENPETPDKEHRGSNAFNSELNVRADRENIVIDAEQENNRRGYKNRQERPNWSVQTQGGQIKIGQTRDSDTHQEGEEYGYASQAR